MFGDKKTKNRRLTPQELADDLIVAKAFKKPVRTFLFDPPTYPYFPPAPRANFWFKHVE